MREDVTVEVASQKTTFVFEPDRYTGKRNQVVVPGEKIDPRRDSRIGVEKTGKGLAFASATWHFSTEKLPEEDRGDFFSVSRSYFLRESTAAGFVLKPLAEGTVVRAGDEVEVQLSLRTKHAAEYVHLRDPAAGRRRAGERPVPLQVGPGDRLVRGDARLGRQLLLRVAAGRRVHVQVPPAGQHGRHVPGRAGDGAVDVRPGVPRLLGGGDADVSVGRSPRLGPSLSDRLGGREAAGRSAENEARRGRDGPGLRRREASVRRCAPRSRRFRSCSRGPRGWRRPRGW